MDKQLKRCRICLKEINNESQLYNLFNSDIDLEIANIRHKLEYCLPEFVSFKAS